METMRQENDIDMQRSTSASMELRYQEHELANAVAVFDLGEDGSGESHAPAILARQVGASQMMSTKGGYGSLP
jgi:hypothetical protein